MRRHLTWWKSLEKGIHDRAPAYQGKRWGEAMARRFELYDGRSRHFWECNMAGPTLFLHWGKIGATGQMQVKTFPSPAAAWSVLGELISHKVHVGYREVATAPPMRPR